MPWLIYPSKSCSKSVLARYNIAIKIKLSLQIQTYSKYSQTRSFQLQQQLLYQLDTVYTVQPVLQRSSDLLDNSYNQSFGPDIAHHYNPLGITYP